MPAPTPAAATLGDALAEPSPDWDEGSALLADEGEGEARPPFAEVVASALAELAAPRDPRKPTARGVWLSGPRGSGKAALVAKLTAAIEARDGAPGDALALASSPPCLALSAAVHRLRALAPVVVHVDVGAAPRALASGIVDAAARRLGAPVPSAVPVGAPRGAGAAVTPRDMTDALASLVHAHRPGARLLLVVLDRADAVPISVLRPVAAHLLLRGGGRTAVIAIGDAPLDDDGGAVDACFPPAQRVAVTDRLLEVVIRDRLLRKRDGARGVPIELGETPKPPPQAIDAEAAGPSFHPFDREVLALLLRIASALARRDREARSAPVPRPLALVEGLLAAARARPHDAKVALDGAFPALAAWLPDGIVAAVEHAGAAGSLPLRAAQAVALLSMLQPEEATTREIVARCLGDRSGGDPQAAEALGTALDDLAARGVLARAPRRGYHVVTPAAAAWIAERAAHDVSGEEVSQAVRDDLAALLDRVPPPSAPGGPYCFRAVYADGRRAHDEPILDRGGGVVIPLDVRHLPLYRRSREEWLGRSVRGKLVDRLIWIAGDDPERIRDVGVELARARRQIRRATPALHRPTGELAQLLEIEAERRDALAATLREAVARTFLEGAFYFRGEGTPARSFGATFDEALLGAVREVLPRMREPFAVDAAGAPAPSDATVVELPRGREVSSIDELTSLLRDIERRIRTQLERGAKKVRID